MNEPILFSVIIPTYNRADLVAKTMLSLLQQTYENFEMIIVDDGSTDNTKELVQSFGDPRVKYYWKENAERGAARNFGLKKASGSYINYFDSDDLAYPHHLQTANELITSNHFPEFVHLGYDHRNAEGELLGKTNRFDGNVVSYVLKKKMISTMSMFIRRDIAELFPYSENRGLVMGEDLLHLCRLVARYPFHYDNTITSSVIQHGQRSMGNTGESELLFCRDHIKAELNKDDIFMKAYGKYIPYICNEYNYMICLNCLLAGDNKKARKYFLLYTREDFATLFNKRTLVFIKNYAKNLFA